MAKSPRYTHTCTTFLMASLAKTITVMVQVRKKEKERIRERERKRERERERERERLEDSQPESYPKSSNGSCFFQQFLD